MHQPILFYFLKILVFIWVLYIFHKWAAHGCTKNEFQVFTNEIIILHILTKNPNQKQTKNTCDLVKILENSVRICFSWEYVVSSRLQVFTQVFSFFTGGTSSLKKMDNYAEIGAPEISGTSSILSVAERNRNNFPNQSQERLLKWTKVTNKPVPCGWKLSHIVYIFWEGHKNMTKSPNIFDATTYK